MSAASRIITFVPPRHPAAIDLAGKDRARDFALPLLDGQQRPLRDLRISVTDRCNLRCTYCMPREVFDQDYSFLPRGDLLTFEEIERIAQVFVRLGVQKIRLTGGEPLLRRGIEQLIERLSRMQTATGEPLQIALTTNGVLLARKARALRDAGLSRVTVSLDGLSDATFRRMSGSDVDVHTILDGIAAAQSAGLAPVKVNMVVKRGANEHEIVPMAEYFRSSGVVLRFIEYMDVGTSNGWRMDEVVPAREILDRIAVHHPLQQLEPSQLGEVAERWRYADGGGEIGVIASVTQAFCHECSRARISTDGKLYTCLFAGDGLDLRSPLRAGASDRGLSGLVADRWEQRNDRYSQQRHLISVRNRDKVEMSYIGG
ncbi:MAG: GTP 3',8-cyclase MoaA [Gammaproteobacteria bacterium]|nr:GTP 3',8-cyclase MoaA [Gammaproteobacteria bacterium]MBU1776802.1 GTP 3',8-cyclase MoaA [Gammaproteobacteria bacterium]MBU1969970.1 GTP 3',8-cyclase MoaA [Gammaproteobacteria bacterium]